MEPSGAAYLEIRRSIAPEAIWQKVPLMSERIYLGRLEAGEPGVDLDDPWISRRHGCIDLQPGATGMRYRLRCLRGRTGIRLYEKLLQPDDSHEIHHGYTFQIPGMLKAPADHCFMITLYISDATLCLAIMPSQPPHFIIFGQPVECTPQEYALLDYLYAHKHEICTYYALIAAIWMPRPHTPERMAEYLRCLHADPDEFSVKYEWLTSLLSRVRTKLREASGGVTFIETIRGKGLRLIC